MTLDHFLKEIFENLENNWFSLYQIPLLLQALQGNCGQVAVSLYEPTDGLRDIARDSGNTDPCRHVSCSAKRCGYLTFSIFGAIAALVLVWAVVRAASP